MVGVRIDRLAEGATTPAKLTEYRYMSVDHTVETPSTNLSNDEVSVLEYIDLKRTRHGLRPFQIAIRMELGMRAEEVEAVLHSLSNHGLIIGRVTNLLGIDTICYEIAPAGIKKLTELPDNHEGRLLRGGPKINDS